MPKVFKTAEDNPDQVEIVGVGVAGSHGRGGILVDDVAEKAHELQDGGSAPLTGKALEEAAQVFADARGLEVVNVKPKDVDGLAQEWGNPPDPIPAGDAAIAEHERVYGDPESEAEQAEESGAGGKTGSANDGGQSTEA
jgi:hypothetical protein